jgi:hypothetical protein
LLESLGATPDDVAIALARTVAQDADADASYARFQLQQLVVLEATEVAA